MEKKNTDQILLRFIGHLRIIQCPLKRRIPLISSLATASPAFFYVSIWCHRSRASFALEDFSAGIHEQMWRSWWSFDRTGRLWPEEQGLLSFLKDLRQLKVLNCGGNNGQAWRRMKDSSLLEVYLVFLSHLYIIRSVISKANCCWLCICTCNCKASKVIFQNCSSSALN